MSNLTWLDYVILAIFALSALVGMSRGFIKEVISLIALIAAFVIATLFASPLAQMFTNSATVQNAVSQASNGIGMDASQPASYIALGLSFAVIFLVTILIGAIIGAILSLAFQTGVLGFGNRLFGALFGLLRGYIFNLVIIFLIQLSPLTSEPWWQQSKMVALFQPSVRWLGSHISPTLANLKAKFGETLEGVGTSIHGVSKKVSDTVK